MRYLNRILIGLLLIASSIGVLYWGSPARSGMMDPHPKLSLLFVVLFALGFIFMAMGALGMKDDYPGFASGLVLYFMVGGLIAIVFATDESNTWRLEDASDPAFWAYWVQIAAQWPILVAKKFNLLGYGTYRTYK